MIDNILTHHSLDFGPNLETQTGDLTETMFLCSINVEYNKSTDIYYSELISTGVEWQLKGSWKHSMHGFWAEKSAFTHFLSIELT